MEILLSIPFVFFLISFVGHLTNGYLTKNAVNGKFIILWKISCAFRSFLFWSIIWIVAVIVGFIIWMLQILEEKYVSIMFMLLIGGPFFAFIVQKAKNIEQDYWVEVVASLENCKVLTNAQMTQLNYDKKTILDGSAQQRKVSLAKIITPKKHKMRILGGDDK